MVEWHAKGYVDCLNLGSMVYCRPAQLRTKYRVCSSLMGRWGYLCMPLLPVASWQGTGSRLTAILHCTCLVVCCVLQEVCSNRSASTSNSFACLSACYLSTSSRQNNIYSFLPPQKISLCDTAFPQLLRREQGKIAARCSHLCLVTNLIPMFI